MKYDQPRPPFDRVNVSDKPAPKQEGLYSLVVKSIDVPRAGDITLTLAASDDVVEQIRRSLSKTFVSVSTDSSSYLEQRRRSLEIEHRQQLASYKMTLEKLRATNAKLNLRLMALAEDDDE